MDRQNNRRNTNKSILVQEHHIPLPSQRWCVDIPFYGIPQGIRLIGMEYSPPLLKESKKVNVSPYVVVAFPFFIVVDV